MRHHPLFSATFSSPLLIPLSTPTVPCLPVLPRLRFLVGKQLYWRCRAFTRDFHLLVWLFRGVVKVLTLFAKISLAIAIARKGLRGLKRYLRRLGLFLSSSRLQIYVFYTLYFFCINERSF